MAKNFSQNKGVRGERAVIALLQPLVDKVYLERGLTPPALERNLMQSHKGGCDIFGMDWIAIEVKHQETLQVNQWWEQAKRQAGADRVPVLIYKQNRMKWTVVMFGYLDAGEKRVRCPCEVSVESFLAYFETKLRIMLLVEMRKKEGYD